MRKFDKITDPFKKDLATRLRLLEGKFTNREAAGKAAGVATITYQSWVDGRSVPSIETMASLAKATGASLDWIAFGEGQCPDGVDWDDVKVKLLREWALLPLHELDLSALYRLMEGEVMQLSFMLGQNYERALRLKEGVA